MNGDNFAFPLSVGKEQHPLHLGLTYRQWLVGQIACGAFPRWVDAESFGDEAETVRSIVSLADAIVKELEKS